MDNPRTEQTSSDNDAPIRAEDDCPPFHIVGIGASAGGLEALEKLFSRMPVRTGMAFIVVQHLSPDFQSHMDELLGRITRIPIHRVEDGMRVEPNNIYLIPSKKEMIISHGRLLLTDKDPERGLTMPIDAFLRSLAQDTGRHAIAVILSGTGSDGSRGVRHVHEADGLVIAQDEDTAKFDGMPLAAIETGVVDLILPPLAIPAALEKYAHEALSPESLAKEELVPVPDEGMEKLLRLLRSKYGIDFAHYKPTTVMRRTERRRNMTHKFEIDEYARFVEENPKELDALYQDLLIGVTTFFRDPESYDRLTQQVVAPILSQVDPHEEIRVWVPGCATGEEAYSLAMVFHEQLEAANRPCRIKLFATDVHRESLDFASTGEYTEKQLGKISAARRSRYFSVKGKKYQVIPDLRKMIVFAPQNVITDAPFTKMHLISCRNLLIYFQPVVQKKVLSLFHFGLRTGGYLFLGPSESPGELRDEFDVIDKHWKIYRKRRDVRLPTNLRMQLTPSTPVIRQRDASQWGSGHRDKSLLDHYDALLARHMPTGILVDEEYHLLHTFAGAEKYLRLRSGRSPMNVLEMFDDELKTAVTGGLQHAKKEGSTVSYTGVHVPMGEKIQNLKLVIEPISVGPDKPGSFMVTFELLQEPKQNPDPETEYDLSEMTREQIGALENELRFTKENLQATIEELETSNEELQATNQELVASNEELQSTNEELQSVNEELYTVNAEHQRKITELSEMTDDMENLLSSTDVGVIYLDRDLCIRRFTPRMAKSFNLLPQDLGRRLDTFAHTIDDPDLLPDVQKVLDTEEGIEKQVRDKSGCPFYLRILPYRSATRVAGVVLTLIEISKLLEAEHGRKQAEEELRASETRKKAILDSAMDAIVTLDPQGKILEFNPAAERMFGYTAKEAIGQVIAERLIPNLLKETPESSAPDDSNNLDSQVEGRSIAMGVRKDQTEFPCEVTLTKIQTEGPLLFTGFIRDITDRVRAETALQERENQFRGTFENAAVGIAQKDFDGHWLRVNDRLCEIVGYAREELLQKTFADITHPDDLEADMIQFQRLCRGEIRSYQLEKRYLHKEGHEIWVALTASLQTDESNRPLYCIAIIESISQRKKFEAELQGAIQAREAFLAMLSHELRNPLSAVLNATRLLKRGLFGETGFSREDVASVIERQTQQMSKLLSDLLDVSRISNGKIELSCKPTNLCELFESVRETVQPTFHEHEIALQVDLPREPVWVEGDPTRLQQIQVNLLGNAAKYSPPASQVQFSIQTSGHQAVIRVKDQGTGIPKGFLKKIFDPFVQSDETLHRSEGGLGVGLTLVSSLVQMHGGTVEAKSKGRGKGSEFLVCLPLVHNPAPEQIATLTHPDHTTSDPLNIVVVEDQADNARLLKAHLEMDGHHVSLAYDGKTGLEIIMNETPDLAILDIGIPVLNGYEVAQKIRAQENGHHVILIALTGYGQPSDLDLAKNAGFDVHLVKPLDLAQLRELLAAPDRIRQNGDEFA